MRDANDVAEAAGSMRDKPAESQRSVKAREDVQQELDATHEELDQAYATIETLNALVSRLRKRLASGS